MPMGPGTYGSKRGRPKKAAAKKAGGLTAKQKTLPKSLQMRIMKAKEKSNVCWLPRTQRGCHRRFVGKAANESKGWLC